MATMPAGTRLERRISPILVAAAARALAFCEGTLRHLLGGDAVAALHPAAEVDVGAALRAEGAEAVHRRRLADRTAAAPAILARQRHHAPVELVGTVCHGVSLARARGRPPRGRRRRRCGARGAAPPPP